MAVARLSATSDSAASTVTLVVPNAPIIVSQGRGRQSVPAVRALGKAIPLKPQSSDVCLSPCSPSIGINRNGSCFCLFVCF